MVYSDQNFLIENILCANIKLIENEGQKIVKSRIKKFCKSKLQRFKIPSKIIINDKKLYFQIYKKSRSFNI